MALTFPHHRKPSWWRLITGPWLEARDHRRRPPASRPFVLLSWGRSGSSLLARLIDAHPGICCHGELLHNEHQKFPPACGPVPYSLCHPTVSRARPAQALDSIFRLASPLGILGWKLLKHQNEPCWEEVLRRPEVRKLVLVRENRLRQYLSLMLARHTRVWQLEAAELAVYRTLRPHPIALDVDALLHQIRQWETEEAALRDTLRNGSAPWMRVVYRDLHPEQRPATLDRIAHFLGAETPAPAHEEPMVRVNPEPWECLVANADEVRHRLTATPWAWMLDDPPGG